MSLTRDALIALVNGQAHDFRQNIEASIQERAMDAIEAERFKLGANLFGEGFKKSDDEDEEGNTLLELSPELKARYIKKAGVSMNHNDSEANKQGVIWGNPKTPKKQRNKAFNKMQKHSKIAGRRDDGLTRANNGA